MTKRAGIRGYVTTPRLFVLHAQLFGQTAERLDPPENILRADPRFRAAQIQHLVANAVREALLAREQSLLDFTKSLTDTDAMSYERLRKIQSGRITMQLADLFAWGSHFPSVQRFLAAESFFWIDPDDTVRFD